MIWKIEAEYEIGDEKIGKQTLFFTCANVEIEP